MIRTIFYGKQIQRHGSSKKTQFLQSKITVWIIRSLGSRESKEIDQLQNLNKTEEKDGRKYERQVKFNIEAGKSPIKNE